MRKIIVVGGGLAGLSATMRLAQQGCHVVLISLTHVKRSHSVCAQGGINAALNLKNEEDSPQLHAYDTIKGGDFLAHQPPVLAMCSAAPGIIQMMDRLGCPFNRTASGELDVRRFGGTLAYRTVFCGASTGQQLLYTLDEQVRRYEAQGLVEKREHHEFLRLIRDGEGRARGIVLLDLFNQKISALMADAVVFATGGPGMIFRLSTNSTLCTGAANGRLYMQGMHYANGEFIQIHPTAIPGHDKLRLISESVRGEGGRMWVYGDSSKSITDAQGRSHPCGETGKPWYFLEELYPAYGNLVARDVGARAVLRICALGLGVEGSSQVYLDVTHLSEEKHHKLASVLAIYQKFTGEDPRKVPMRIFPAVHYSMGGAWVDWPEEGKGYRQMTNLPGCFQCGESEYQYHGANRLGANSLLSCIFAGLVVGEEVPRYLDSLSSCSSTDRDASVREEEQALQHLLHHQGTENAYRLHEELSDWMVRHVTVERNNPDLEKTLAKLHELRERSLSLTLDDSTRFANQALQFALQFRPMLELAFVMTKGALLRNESRGSHFKQAFPLRDDAQWLKTTLAHYAPDEPRITYAPVDTRHLTPEPRDYATRPSHAPHFKNLQGSHDTLHS